MAANDVHFILCKRTYVSVLCAACEHGKVCRHLSESAATVFYSAVVLTSCVLPLGSFLNFISLFHFLKISDREAEAPAPSQRAPGRRPCALAPPTVRARVPGARPLLRSPGAVVAAGGAPASSSSDVTPTEDYFRLLRFRLLGSLISQKAAVFDDGSILYCLIKTKHFLSSHPFSSPSMELLCSIKTFLNLRSLQ